MDPTGALTEKEVSARVAEIPGWFPHVDRIMFKRLLGMPGPAGEIVELGTYLGKSASWIGHYLREGDRLTVLDVFAGDDGSRTTTTSRFERLTRSAFEANYLSVNDTLPTIVSGYSTEITRHVPARSVRFLHIDASHNYDDVRDDIASAYKLLRKNGVVVFDDYRTHHAPDVAAAVWPEVVAGRLKVICCTANKLYATPGDPAAGIRVVTSIAKHRPNLKLRVRQVAGQEVHLLLPVGTD